MSLSREELLNWVENRLVLGEGLDILKNDCEIIVFMLDHCDIKIPEQNRFFVQINCTGISDFVIKKRKRILSGLVRVFITKLLKNTLLYGIQNIF